MMYPAMLLPEVVKTETIIASAYLGREVALELFIPRALPGNERLNLLLLNDGQETAALGLQETLSQLYGNFKIEPLVVVAIKASADRLQEYGVANHPDFLGRGSKAVAYTCKGAVPFYTGQS
jgi:hypothetical protein